MEVRSAVKRLGWRFSQAAKREDLSFRINQADINALELIGEFVEISLKQQFEANHLFAKLYIYLFQKVLEQDGTTVFDNDARKKIGNVLKMPLSQCIENLQKSLNDSEQYALLYKAGHDFQHPQLRQGIETTEVLERLNTLLKKHENLSALTGKAFEFDTVSEAVMAEVNQQINLHR